MFTSFKHSKKGFTLIELLVVIAIIGILSSVVLASLSTARQKSRDAKRISDIGQIQLALELYFDRVQSYPSTTPSICGAAGAAPAACASTAAAAVNGANAAIVGLAAVQQAFLPKAPSPAGGAGVATEYYYYGLDSVPANCTAATQSCVSYNLGAALEREDNTVLQSDADITNAVFYGGTGAGTANDCGAAQNATDNCYDIKP
jgi:prepilin-type N-terminal cleavage/methylation domain-containing protein